MSMNSITATNDAPVSRHKPAKSDITGKKFNRLTALYPTDKRDTKGRSSGTAAATAEKR